MAVVTDHAGLEASELEALRSTVAPLATLEHVIHWGLSLPGSPTIAEVITQDEYTHDVVLPYSDHLFIVFDST